MPIANDELAITPLAAQRLRIGVGDTLQLYLGGADALFEPPPGAQPSNFRVVGLVAAQGGFPPLTGGLGPLVLLAPTYAATHPPGAQVLGLRLRHGNADIASFMRRLGRLAPGQQIVTTTSNDFTAIDRSLSVQANALRIVGVARRHRVRARARASVGVARVLAGGRRRDAARPRRDATSAPRARAAAQLRRRGDRNARRRRDRHRRCLRSRRRCRARRGAASGRRGEPRVPRSRCRGRARRGDGHERCRKHVRGAAPHARDDAGPRPERRSGARNDGRVDGGDHGRDDGARTGTRALGGTGAFDDRERDARGGDDRRRAGLHGRSAKLFDHPKLYGWNWDIQVGDSFAPALDREAGALSARTRRRKRLRSGPRRGSTCGDTRSTCWLSSPARVRSRRRWSRGARPRSPTRSCSGRGRCAMPAPRRRRLRRRRAR